MSISKGLQNLLERKVGMTVQIGCSTDPITGVVHLEALAENGDRYKLQLTQRDMRDPEALRNAVWVRATKPVTKEPKKALKAIILKGTQ